MCIIYHVLHKFTPKNICEYNNIIILYIEMGFTDNVYRIEIDTSNVLGKIEDKILQYVYRTEMDKNLKMKWKHKKNGKIKSTAPIDSVFDKFYGLKWEYADNKKKNIIYRFYLSIGNKIIYLDDINIIKDFGYLQKNGDYQFYGNRFGFTYKFKLFKIKPAIYETKFKNS